MDELIGEMGNPIVNSELAVSNVLRVIEKLLSQKNQLWIFLIMIGMGWAGTIIQELYLLKKESLANLCDSDLK